MGKEATFSKTMTLAESSDEATQKKIEKHIRYFFLPPINKRLELLKKENDILHEKLGHTKEIIDILIESFIILINKH